MKDEQALAVSDVEDGVGISSPDPPKKPLARPLDPPPMEPPYMAVSNSTVYQPFKLSFQPSTFSAPHHVVKINLPSSASNYTFRAPRRRGRGRR